MTPTQCISYCLDRPAVASILGGINIDQIKDALKYCSHCAPCVEKINIADVNKYLDLAQVQGFVPETV